MEGCPHASEEREIRLLQGHSEADLNSMLFCRSSSLAKGHVAAAMERNPQSGTSQTVPLILFTSLPDLFFKSLKNARRHPIRSAVYGPQSPDLCEQSPVGRRRRV
ncbi:hypothetical protein ACLOJK_020116 [Asimina triloba]